LFWQEKAHAKAERFARISGAGLCAQAAIAARIVLSGM
jgi:hypothetical protein